MSEFVLPIASGVIGSLSGILGSYIVLKRTMKTEVLIEKFSEITKEVGTNEALQKNIYVIGGIFGQGLAQGMGIKGLIPGQGKTKFSIEGLIGGFLQNSGILNKFLGGQQQPPAQQPPAQTW